MSKLLFRASRLTVTNAVGLSFLGYTFYDHLHTGTITRRQQHADVRYSTVHHTSKMDRTYDVLPKLPDQRSIRLIKLHGAANRDDDMHIDLATVSLDKPPSYEALSYAWGRSEPDQIVYISGMKFGITKNVQTVMKELRLKPGKSRYLWIDAICINQKDLAERASHVAMMAEIYKKAHGLISGLATVISQAGFFSDSLSTKASFFCKKAHSCFFILLGGLNIFGYNPMQGFTEIMRDGVAD